MPSLCKTNGESELASCPPSCSSTCPLGIVVQRFLQTGCPFLPSLSEHSVSLWFLWLIVLLYCTYVLVYSSTAATTLHLFNSLFSSTTWASQYPKGKTSLDLNGAKDDVVLGWQWHQLDHIQTICISIQTDNHTNTLSLNFYRPDAFAQRTVSKHWRTSCLQ